MNHGTHRQTQGRPRLGGTRAGFTLIELLVIILIVGLLMGIMAPALALYKRRVMDNLSTIAFRQLDAAVLMYLEHFQDFPPSQDTNYKNPDGMNPGIPWRGSQMLALFLTGYGPDGDPKGQPVGRLDQDDGCEGYGFRILKRGKVYGPYNDAHKAPMRGQYHHSDGADYTVPRFFVDAYDNPILYYKFDTAAGQYNEDNDDNGFPTPGPETINSYAKDNSKYYRRDFILISMGSNGAWTSESVPASDDLTNFFLNR